MFRHEDDRRVIYDWAQGSFASAKALVAKCDCTVGDHYHLKKDESFFLLSGRASRIVIGGEEYCDQLAPRKWDVPRGAYHRFDLDAGSILLGMATAEFDPNDEIRGNG